jgi:hypothetical protein
MQNTLIAFTTLNLYPTRKRFGEKFAEKMEARIFVLF